MKLHPDLLNNSLFLRYFQRWQEDPLSVIFAPVAEYFLLYDMPDQAYVIAKEGLSQHPDLISGHLVMAKIHKNKGNAELAKGELRLILSKVPNHTAALKMMRELDADAITPLEKRSAYEKSERPLDSATFDKVESGLIDDADEEQASMINKYESGLNDSDEKTEEPDDDEDMSMLAHWQTLTMARIFSSQGHIKKARRIYKAILDKEPENMKAREGLESLGERL